ncbi:hypothetical protein M5D96_001417 [Drosophila gunungcola]|uniref:Uncharacterized protein n=1 Tax=Drosophila gunungcola TaxID=103775 RepID=A0A9P9YY34_9MUSC|nr:hypothetical protein M5D96_001417 [Drosophila gunungcola]
MRLRTRPISGTLHERRRGPVGCGNSRISEGGTHPVAGPPPTQGHTERHTPTNRPEFFPQAVRHALPWKGHGNRMAVFTKIQIQAHSAGPALGSGFGFRTDCVAFDDHGAAASSSGPSSRMPSKIGIYWID